MAVLPRVGDVFGRYRIDAQIGRGGMGVVYGATDTTVGRTVALKVVSSVLGDSTDFRLRFEREAAVLARLDSPHVIAIYDYGTEDDCPYIATQYVGGGDIGGLLHERGAMPPSLALRVCAQVADALHDAHRAGVVHRDVKPTNVLLRDADTVDMHAYLCDFGIARTATDGLTAPGAVAGTWSYLSPECGRGAPGTPSSDIYALGCLLWACLSGSPPYRGSDVEVAVAHQQAPIPQLDGDDDLSRHVDLILRRCLAKAPGDRYADADQLRTDLLAAAGIPDSGFHAPVTAAPTRPTSGRPGSSDRHLSLGSLPPRMSPTTAPPSRRRSRWTAVLVSAAVLAIVGGIVAATRLGGENPSAGPGTATTSGSTGPSEPTSGPTDGPTDGLTDEPTDGLPERVDQGGPITGDQDGDGLGDLSVTFYHTVAKGKKNDTFTDQTDWTSDGSDFTQGPTRWLSSAPKAYDQRLLGDFDGDDVLEQIVLREFNERDRSLQVRGELSGGGTIDSTVTKDRPTVFAGITDLDGDGADDVVLQYYLDYDVGPTTFAGIVIDGTDVSNARELLVVPDTAATSSFEVGDFDGDGVGDIAILRQGKDAKEIGDYHHRLTLWRGDGTATGTRRGATEEFVAGYRPELVRGDVDGDEDDELLVVGGGVVLEIGVVDVRGGRLKGPTAAGALRGRSGEMVVGVTDVNGDGLDDVVGVDKATDNRVQLLVARNDQGRFVASRWGVWERDFKTSKYFSNLEIIGRSFS